jgi:S1-C subfamily serine protease
VDGLMREGDLDFWAVAQRLSEAGHIKPLTTRGIIGQVTDSRIIYDAATASGGSGGPVLGLDGHVHAVNSAILPEFGGSNLGVPAEEARRILEEAAGGSR